MLGGRTRAEDREPRGSAGRGLGLALTAGLGVFLAQLQGPLEPGLKLFITDINQEQAMCRG